MPESSMFPRCTADASSMLRDVRTLTPFEPAARAVSVQVEGQFYFKCDGEVEARCLLGKMELAGCVMYCLGHRYDIKKQIGEGGFSNVFSAVDKLNGAPVAIKLISTAPKGTHPLKEAALLQRLRHPNLLEFKGVYYVHDPELLRLAGAEADQAWALVTELLDGMDLHTRIVHRKLKGAEAQVGEL